MCSLLKYENARHSYQKAIITGLRTLGANREVDVVLEKMIL